MKYVAIILGVITACYFWGRNAPAKPVVQAVTAQEVAPLTTGSREAAAPASNALKRPLDRTHAVLDQVKTRNGDGEF